MTLKFIATKERKTYLATDIRCYDGNTAKISSYRGRKLLKVYPENFFEVETINQEAILNEIIKIFKPEGGYEIKGIKVTQNGKLKVDYDNGR